MRHGDEAFDLGEPDDGTELHGRHPAPSVVPAASARPAPTRALLKHLPVHPRTAADHTARGAAHERRDLEARP